MNLPKAIACLPKWADDRPYRYDLDCVRLTWCNDYVRAEATDGCRLARLTWPCRGGDNDYLLPAKQLAKSLRAIKVKRDGYSASLNGRVTLWHGERSVDVPAAALEKWPDTAAVLDPSPSADSQPVDVVHLREEARAAIKKGDKPYRMVVILCGIPMLLNGRYVRDMCDTAIKCGMPWVQAYAEKPTDPAHFVGRNGDLLFQSVVMPLMK